MANIENSTVQLPYPAENLIVHRPPMLLIDFLTEREGDTAAASATIDENSTCFCDSRGILPEYFIEIMAQTMAAANGYDALLEQSPPKSGFIVGLDKFQLHYLPSGKQKFTIQIVKIMEFGSMKIMEGKVHSGSTPVAKVELKVWEQDQDESE